MYSCLHAATAFEEDWMSGSRDKPQPEHQKPKVDQTKAGAGVWTYSPSNPPDLHAKPLIKKDIDREGLRKALERVGVAPE
jgi:hypothetical protein